MFVFNLCSQSINKENETKEMKRTGNTDDQPADVIADAAELLSTGGLPDQPQTSQSQTPQSTTTGTKRPRAKKPDASVSKK